MNTDNLINLIPTILKDFSVDYSSIDSISYLSEGEENWIFRIDCQENKYVLRVGKNVRSLKDAEFEYLFEAHLYSNKIPLPKHYSTKDNKPHHECEIEGKKLTLTLYDFIPGEIVKNPNINQIKAMSQLISELHLSTKSFHIDFDRLSETDALSWLDDLVVNENDLEKYTPKLNEAFGVYKELSNILKTELNKLPKYVLHNDIYFNNVLFQGDELKALIDFDECHKHYIACELGWSLNKICNFGDYDNYINNIKTFLGEYTRLNSINNEELYLTFANLICEGARKYCKRIMTSSLTDEAKLEYENISRLYKSYFVGDKLAELLKA